MLILVVIAKTTITPGTEGIRRVNIRKLGLETAMTIFIVIVTSVISITPPAPDSRMFMFLFRGLTVTLVFNRKKFTLKTSTIVLDKNTVIAFNLTGTSNMSITSITVATGSMVAKDLCAPLCNPGPNYIIFPHNRACSY